ncbi:MAG: poly(hydroxyalkanoate) granule-associated protein [Chloroflexaceae bacterium]|nr:poly(hydroxyalkanoate) granule-associated protein [Chloroflexaceae bacterium]
MTTEKHNPEEIEVEVHVRQLDDPTQPGEVTPVSEIVRRLVLAGVGVVAVTFDEAERLVNRLVERGELAQKDSEKIMAQVMERLRVPTQPMQPQPPVATSSTFASTFESNLEQFLNRLNIPSQRDIDELSAKLAQLTARVEELRRQVKTDTE